MTYAILSINIKGGTGKSTVAEHLAYELRDRGHDVGVMDADIDSANLASRFGAEERVTFKGDHIIQPVETDGIELYSMENAFEESSFSQSGDFMGDVIQQMINSSAFNDPDYLIVDCPPGSSDVFEELVRALRKNLLGAISVGIPDAVEDTARLVKVCNHNWVPVLGFIENMSGVYCHGEMVTCSNSTDGDSFSTDSHAVEPFGNGEIEAFATEMGGNFLGSIPLCHNPEELPDAAQDAISSAAETIEDADEPAMPEDNIGQEGFVRNVIKSVLSGFKQINKELPVDRIQNEFGVEDREPLVIKIEITDAGPITGMMSSFIVTARDGELKVMREGKASRKGIRPEGGMKITSQDLYDAINGEKKVMRSVNGEITTEPYSIIDAVKMGDADIWGDRTINRLSVLDRIMTDVVDMSDVQKAMQNA